MSKSKNKHKLIDVELLADVIARIGNVFNEFKLTDFEVKIVLGEMTKISDASDDMKLKESMMTYRLSRTVPTGVG